MLRFTWLKLGALRSFEWRQLLPQDSVLWADHHAVSGFGGVVPADYLIELGGGLTPPHSLCLQLCSGRLASAGDCPETARANGVGIPLSPKQRYLRSYQ